MTRNIQNLPFIRLSSKLFSKLMACLITRLFGTALLITIASSHSTAFAVGNETSDQSPQPGLLLAKNYHTGINLAHYWVSEKLDGIRARWDGKQLISRQGNAFSAPNWFTKNFPDQPLDGELWIGRNQFETLASTVRKFQPVDAEWKEVKYMIFDLPGTTKPFTERLADLKIIISSINNPHIELIEQSRSPDHQTLMKRLDHMVKAGAEGLMLHRGDSLYKNGRHPDLLKVKRHEDAEAIVIAHLPGKGKYKGLLGALLVEMPDGKKFRIGTGFKDKERANPPPIGSTITYKFFGKTRKGIPKFASFLRVRKHIHRSFESTTTPRIQPPPLEKGD